MIRKLHPVDHPIIANAGIASVVAAHFTLTHYEQIPAIWDGFLAQNVDLQVATYMGFLGAAAIVAGFAGVVVVFGLSGTSDRFRKLRVLGGKSLARNWTSTSASGFLAGGIALLAALLAMSGLSAAGPWLLEVAIGVAVHASIRILWLLRSLVTTVAADDVETERRLAKRAPDQMPWKRNKPDVPKAS